MMLERRQKRTLGVLIGFIVMALIYSRPYSFAMVMREFYDSPIEKCEAIYYQQEAGENGKPKYTTIYKEFDLASEDYKGLIELLESVFYRRQLAVALSGGTRNGGYSVSYPYSEITFYQDGKVYVYRLFNRYLPAGPVRERWDYTPEGGRAFHAQVTEFIRTHGVTIKEEIQQH